ncbi:MAG: xanthine phosphoribosyltransferase [Alphaproteobacteria bacterium]|jgi:xanthine phosphoribosyltransferase|nr:xanthine phosphoribosyltransferase [Alphaproteobacteria bacterium]
MSEKVYITWEQFFEDSKELSKRIKEMNLNIKGIVCITRGGLAPTAIVSSQLNIRKIETFSIKTYSDSAAQESSYEILTTPLEALADKGEGWIIVDELVDTGNTAEYILEQLPLAKFFVLYSKIPNHKSITKYIKDFDKSIWLCLPWELEV